MEITLSLITTFTFLIQSYFIGMYIFENNKVINRKLTILLLALTIIFSLIVKFTSATFFLCFMLIIFYKLLFKKDLIEAISLSVIVSTLIEVIKIIYLIVFDHSWEVLCNFENYNISKFLVDIISLSLCTGILYITRNITRNILNKIIRFKYCNFVLLSIFVINLLIEFIFRYSFNQFSLFTITDLVGAIVILISLIYSIERGIKLDLVSKNYDEVSRYSKLHEELNLDYRMRVHENRNQLIIIKGMIDGKKEDLEEYVDCLLESKAVNVNNYWLSDLAHIPLPGMKNFLNHKLTELKNIGANIEISISNDLEKINLNNLRGTDYRDFSTILGVVLDNMIESVKDQEEKLISVNLFLEDNKIHGEFVNSVNNSNIDLDKLYRRGYSTKGGSHGVGLSLVYDIVSKNDSIDCKPSIIDNFFVQNVTLRLNNTKNH